MIAAHHILESPCTRSAYLPVPPLQYTRLCESACAWCVHAATCRCEGDVRVRAERNTCFVCVSVCLLFVCCLFVVCLFMLHRARGIPTASFSSETIGTWKRNAHHIRRDCRLPVTHARRLCGHVGHGIGRCCAMAWWRAGALRPMGHCVCAPHHQRQQHREKTAAKRRCAAL